VSRRPPRPAHRRSALAAVALAALALGLWAPTAGVAGPSLPAIQGKIARARGELAQVRGRGRVLTTDIAAISGRIRALQGDIGRLQRREGRLQAALDRERAELARLQGELRAARARLVALRARLARARRVLAQRLVALYESDRADLVSVVLDARGFADLLERGHYLAEIGAQDQRIIAAVREARAATQHTVRRLAVLETRQQAVTSAIQSRRDQVAGVRRALERRRASFDRRRAQRAALLARVRNQAAHLRHRLDFLASQQAAIERRIAAASGMPAGALRGGGRFIWPVNGPITSPFCERRAWEACHPGVDIGVPSGTPIHAAGSGRVILAGPASGYGNYTCIGHGGGVSTCYAHQSAILVHVGQSVARGQVIGRVGCTGRCYGPHLHFEVRVNGAVTNPLNYL
jgi:murein DD-endopeptidase MepM/ murein hydrolase activator NlpD